MASPTQLAFLLATWFLMFFWRFIADVLQSPGVIINSWSPYQSLLLSWLLLVLPGWPWTATAHRRPSCCAPSVPLFSDSNGRKWQCKTRLHFMTLSDLSRSTAAFQILGHPYQSEAFQSRMLPHGMIEDILHQWVVFSPTVTFEDAHSGRFPFPWGQTWTMTQW